MRKLIYLFILFANYAFAQVPANYYENTENLNGIELQAVLHQIIDNHTIISYSALWSAFYETDAKSNNKVWDIYSDVPGGTPAYEFTFSSNQCGNYNSEGDCYNREHSFPTSWFNDQSPMNSDLFQIYPTDGYVNQKRGNYPYGETNNANWISTNGSKLGACSVSGYNGTIFEPINEYKGDIARTYFYMATRYYGEDAGWPGSPMCDGAQPEAWAITMLLSWHQNDPVNEKEISRNNAIFLLQKNRNP
ncbi:MAG TPA: endonuclease, partial [Prolixibacteraceae bacterium]|nr:endonuclease [Prolixibacteraceae bacterium]